VSDDPLTNAEALLTRLEAARERLEATEDPEAALELLDEIAQLARDAHTEIQRAKDQVDA
jgi:exonuclease VII small subunit